MFTVVGQASRDIHPDGKQDRDFSGSNATLSRQCQQRQRGRGCDLRFRHLLCRTRHRFGQHHSQRLRQRRCQLVGHVAQPRHHPLTDRWYRDSAQFKSKPVDDMGLFYGRLTLEEQRGLVVISQAYPGPCRTGALSVSITFGKDGSVLCANALALSSLPVAISSLNNLMVSSCALTWSLITTRQRTYRTASSDFSPQPFA